MKNDASATSWEAFLKLCTEFKSPAELNVFFSLFLTHEERETMASRFIIVKKLLENTLTQRELSETHHVSIAQITRGSNALKSLDPHFKKNLEKKLKSKKVPE